MIEFFTDLILQIRLIREAKQAQVESPWKSVRGHCSDKHVVEIGDSSDPIRYLAFCRPLEEAEGLPQALITRCRPEICPKMKE